MTHDVSYKAGDGGEGVVVGWGEDLSMGRGQKNLRSGGEHDVGG